MKAKIIKADSGTTKYLYACMKFSGDEFGDRDYPGEWVTCTDLIEGNEVIFTKRTSGRIFVKTKEERDLANFILKNFDELKDVEEISPRDWKRVIENV